MSVQRSSVLCSEQVLGRLCSCTVHKKEARMMLPTPQPALDLEGPVLTPNDPGYDHSRTVFAAHVDRRPALIARVAGPDDVARLIAHARDTGSELAVRGGGH